MQDRQPTPGQEGRVLITPENGSPYYAVMEMADNPIRTGTPLNAANLLSDATANRIGLSGEAATPDKAFERLAQIIYDSLGGVIIHLTVQAADGTKIPNAQITGVTSLSGGAAVTDTNGQVTCVSLSSNPTIGWGQDFADLETGSQQITAEAGETVNRTVTVTARNFAEYTESCTIKFSPLCTRVDVSLLGGGGGGGAGKGQGPNYYSSAGGGGGGAGGETATQEDVAFVAASEYPLHIGAGGAGGTSRSAGGVGGNTTLMNLTAQGGEGGGAGVYVSWDDTANGGTGSNGNGGNGAGVGPNREAGAATSGTRTIYASFTETVVTGGGGGGGGAKRRDDDEASYNVTYQPTEGAGNGGDGGEAVTGNPDGKNGTLGGGGGGGGAYTRSTTYPNGQMVIGKGGNGGDGKAALRMWHGEESTT